MKKNLLILTLASLGLLRTSFAQQPSGIHSMGQDFYFTELAPSIHCSYLTQYQSSYLLISAFYDCKVTVDYFSNNGTELGAGTYVLTAGRGEQLSLDQSFMDPKDQNGNPINPNGEKPQYTACHIHATRPISVSYYSTGPNAGGMTLVLPVQALGKHYIVASLPANPAAGAANGSKASYNHCTLDSSSSEFGIVAVTDSTSVTIIPNGRTLMGDIGTNTGLGATGAEHPVTVMLSRGQVYWVKSTTGDPTNDMSGSMVRASEPVAVFAGNGDALHGTASNFSGDERNMIVQQLVPTKYWRTSDYIGIPFKDVSSLDSADPSAGDEYKIYTCDSASTELNFAAANITTEQRSIALPNTPLAAFGNVEAATDVSANNRIQVEQYDYRAVGGSPNTAPTMMNVVPLENFDRMFCFQVPTPRDWNLKRHFISVIARSSQFGRIFLRENNGAPQSLASMTADGASFSIPNHSTLVGRRYAVTEGSYVLTGDSAFMVYQYGMEGLDPENDLGDNDDDDYYYEYAEPAGQSFGIEGAQVPSITVDTVCGGWDLAARDTVQVDGGISSVQILNDPDGILLRKPNTDSGYVSTNVDFDPVNFTVIPGSTSITSSIRVDNPLQPATVWVLVTNAAGHSTLVELHYTPIDLALSVDSILFYKVMLESDTCAQFVLRNKNAVGRPAIMIGSSQLRRGDQGFVRSSTYPQLPYALASGDSIMFAVCFQAPTPLKGYFDTLDIQAGCQMLHEPLLGYAVVGNINASDYDFGAVRVGAKQCASLRVWNSGSAPMELTNHWVLDNFRNFSFTDSAKLPITLQPGFSNGVILRFCFMPTDTFADSTEIHWSTDLPKQYSDSIKNFSILEGYGVAPELAWDKPVQFFASRNGQIQRITLRDSGNARITIDSVEIIGPDTSEFHIVGTQNPPQFTLQPVGTNGAQTSEWCDIEFSPDTSVRNDRVDTLVAFDEAGIHPKAVLHGIIGSLSVSDPTLKAEAIQFRVIGDELILQIPPVFQMGGAITLFDEVGRALRRAQATGSTASIDLAGLPNGAYFLRVSNGSESAVTHLIISR